MSDILPPEIPITTTTSTNSIQGNTGKATAAFILGITSLVMCSFITGIPAIILGRMYMRDVLLGIAPASSLGKAKAGYIMGIISVILFVLPFLFVLYISSSYE